MENNNKLKHIALEIYPDDLKDFYQEILHGEIAGERVLNEDAAKSIFGINATTKIYFVNWNGIELELFVHHDSHCNKFNHICLETERAGEIFQKAAAEKYFVKKWGDEKSPTYFIKDRNGNMFELKIKFN